MEKNYLPFTPQLQLEMSIPPVTYRDWHKLKWEVKFPWLCYSVSKKGGEFLQLGHCYTLCLNLFIVGSLMMKIRLRNRMPINKHNILYLLTL